MRKVHRGDTIFITVVKQHELIILPVFVKDHGNHTGIYAENNDVFGDEEGPIVFGHVAKKHVW